jgi:hypothetical protein
MVREQYNTVLIPTSTEATEKYRGTHFAAEQEEYIGSPPTYIYKY